MNIMSLRVGRSLAATLLCALSCLTLADSVLADSRFALVDSTPKTLTPAALAAAQNTETKGRPTPDGKSLTFAQNVVRLVAVTGPEDDMLSYRIAGKRNPTLLVPRGATIKMLFVNTDDDMFHNIRFGAPLKTYANVMTAYLKSSVGTPDLPHKSAKALHGEELTLRAPAAPGSYVYLCTIRGHAQGGMVGKVVVR